jgi:hypothetical protein
MNRREAILQRRRSQREGRAQHASAIAKQPDQPVTLAEVKAARVEIEHFLEWIDQRLDALHADQAAKPEHITQEREDLKFELETLRVAYDYVLARYLHQQSDVQVNATNAIAVESVRTAKAAMWIAVAVGAATIVQVVVAIYLAYLAAKGTK